MLVDFWNEQFSGKKDKWFRENKLELNILKMLEIFNPFKQINVVYFSTKNDKFDLIQINMYQTNVMCSELE